MLCLRLFGNLLNREKIEAMMLPTNFLLLGWFFLSHRVHLLAPLAAGHQLSLCSIALELQIKQEDSLLLHC